MRWFTLTSHLENHHLHLEKIMKISSSIVLFVMTMLVSSMSLAQDLETGSSFEGNFSIDAMHTMDGVNYQVAASGEAGEYGRVYLSYTFTNKLSLNEMGEFTGYAWTQSGEDIVTGYSARSLEEKWCCV